MVAKAVVVAAPIAVEAELPESRCRKANGVVILGGMEEVGDHHHVIAWPTLIPAVKGDHLAGIVQMVDLNGLHAKTTGTAVTVAAQANQVVVQSRIY